MALANSSSNMCSLKSDLGRNAEVMVEGLNPMTSRNDNMNIHNDKNISLMSFVIITGRIMNDIFSSFSLFPK
jgi:hypothetical protein